MLWCLSLTKLNKMVIIRTNVPIPNLDLIAIVFTELQVEIIPTSITLH